MENVFDTLKARGCIKQTVYEEDLYKKLGSEHMSFYIGFDPTADSLHVGHFIQLIVMRWMQKAGHRPIILIGGGTGMIGDPSGRSDLRKVMTAETVQHNCDCFKEQMSKFLSFEGENAAIMVNNADWLKDLNYIDFLREIGSVFSVNKMLTAECYKQRLEKGLTFLEFNYMLMQAYDFLVLNRKYGCELECGGDDQWSNMLAGVDLIRRKEGKDAFAMTSALLTTSEGKKMGKTQKGAVWLDREKTSPYEFFQYWRNIDDADVEKCLKLLTEIDLDEIAELCRYKDERMNRAKEVLAYELTKLVHGKDDADLSLKQSKGAFGDGAEMPEKTIEEGTTKVIDILVAIGVAPSKSEARRLIEGGGIRVNDDKVTDVNAEVTSREFIIHKGKKVHFKVSVK